MIVCEAGKVKDLKKRDTGTGCLTKEKKAKFIKSPPQPSKKTTKTHKKQKHTKSIKKSHWYRVPKKGKDGKTY